MSYLGGLFNLAIIPVATGGSFLVSEPSSGRTVLSFWPTVERFGIDALWMVPSLVRGLTHLAEKNRATRRIPVRKCFIGTAPVTRVEKQRFGALFGIEMLENYGLTETTFISSERSSAPVSQIDGSVGTKLPYVDVELRCLGDNHADLPGAREIWVRSPYLMLGYLEDGVLKPSVDDEGFFPTGDLGAMENGELVLCGRLKDIIKKGGLLIVLKEIERLAMSYPAVLEAAAVPVPHAFYGETYVLAVRTKNAGAMELEPFNAWVQERLARHKWPEKTIILDDFPRTRSGKILKQALVRELTTAGD
jgi:acyl-CoA synthetase (AMP-forming)/AMP-acid ligase II